VSELPSDIEVLDALFQFDRWVASELWEYLGKEIIEGSGLRYIGEKSAVPDVKTRMF
jgi:hypothetical protein